MSNSNNKLKSSAEAAILSQASQDSVYVSENLKMLEQLNQSESVHIDQEDEMMNAVYEFKEELKNPLGQLQPVDYKLKRSNYKSINVLYDKVAQLVQGSNYAWINENIVKNKGLLFDKGDRYTIGHVLHQQVRVSNNMKCFEDNNIKEWVQHELKALVKAGFLAKCKESDLTACLPFFVVDNGRKYRMVYNARDNNFKFKPERFNLPSQMAPLINTDHYWYAKTDLSNAFYSIKVSDDLSRQFGIYYEGQYYRYLAIPFGWNCSPMVFTLWYAALLAGIWREVHELKEIKGVYQPTDYAYLQYIDDVLFSGCCARVVNIVKAYVDSRLKSVGLIVAEEKDVLASQSIEWLGFTLQNRYINLTQKAEQRLVTEIDRALQSAEQAQAKSMHQLPAYSVNDHLHLLGILGQFATLSPRGRTLHCELMRMVNPDLRKQNPWKNQKITYQMGKLEVDNLEAIKESLKFFKGYRLQVHDKSYEFYTDAAKEGINCTFGACDRYFSHLTKDYSAAFYDKVKGIYMNLHDVKFQEKYMTYLKMIHQNDIQDDGQPTIAVLEALALVIAVKEILSHNKELRSCNLIAYVDNQTVVKAFQSHFSKSLTLQSYLTEVASLTQQRQVNFVVRYIQTQQNPADVFSRASRINGSWQGLFSHARYPVRAYEIIKYTEKEEIVVLSQFDHVLNELQNHKIGYQAFHTHKGFILQNILYLMGPKLIMVAKALISLAMRLSKRRSRIDNLVEYRMIIESLKAYNLFNETLYQRFMKKGSCSDLELESILTPEYSAYTKQVIDCDLANQPYPSLRNLDNQFLIEKKRKLNNFCEINIISDQRRNDGDDEFEGGSSEDPGPGEAHFMYYSGQSKGNSYSANAIKNAYNQANQKRQTVLDLKGQSYFKDRFLQKIQFDSGVFSQPPKVSSWNSYNALEIPQLVEFDGYPVEQEQLAEFGSLFAFESEDQKLENVQVLPQVDYSQIQALEDKCQTLEGKIKILEDKLKYSEEVNKSISEIADRRQALYEDSYNNCQEVYDSYVKAQAEARKWQAQWEQHSCPNLECEISEWKSSIKKQEIALIAEQAKVKQLERQIAEHVCDKSQDELIQAHTSLKEIVEKALVLEVKVENFEKQESMMKKEYLQLQNANSQLTKEAQLELKNQHDKLVQEFEQTQELARQASQELQKGLEQRLKLSEVQIQGFLEQIQIKDQKIFDQSREIENFSVFEKEQTTTNLCLQDENNDLKDQLQKSHEMLWQCQESLALVQVSKDKSEDSDGGGMTGVKRSFSSPSYKQGKATSSGDDPQRETITVTPFGPDNPDEQHNLGSQMGQSVSSKNVCQEEFQDYSEFLESHKRFMQTLDGRVVLRMTAVEELVFEDISKINYACFDYSKSIIFTLESLVADHVAHRTSAADRRLVQLSESQNTYAISKSILQAQLLDLTEAGLDSEAFKTNWEDLGYSGQVVKVLDFLVRSPCSLRHSVQLLDFDRIIQAICSNVQDRQDKKSPDPYGLVTARTMRRVLWEIVPSFLEEVQNMGGCSWSQEVQTGALSELYDYCFWYSCCFLLNLQPWRMMTKKDWQIDQQVPEMCYFIAKHMIIYLYESEDGQILSLEKSQAEELRKQLEKRWMGLHPGDYYANAEQVEESKVQETPHDDNQGSGEQSKWMNLKSLRYYEKQRNSASHDQPQGSKKLGRRPLKHYNNT